MLKADESDGEVMYVQEVTEDESSIVAASGPRSIDRAHRSSDNGKTTHGSVVRKRRRKKPKHNDFIIDGQRVDAEIRMQTSE